jgi:hypothetical protein
MQAEVSIIRSAGGSSVSDFSVSVLEYLHVRNEVSGE